MIKIASLNGLTFPRLLITGIMLAGIMLILSASQVKSQTLWSLQDCINYAFDHNLDIKKQVLAVETNKANLLQSKLNTLPSINAGASTVNNWGRTIDRYTNEFATNRVRSDNLETRSISDRSTRSASNLWRQRHLKLRQFLSRNLTFRTSPSRCELQRSNQKRHPALNLPLPAMLMN